MGRFYKEMLKAYLQLMRLPNTFTSAADIMAGYLLVSGLEIQLAPLILLSLASMSLYAGGVILNDYFDYYSDLKERPERPLPAGNITRFRALLFGLMFLLLGNGLAFKVNWYSFITALTITLLIFLYDALSKDIPFFGPLTMAGCRFFNIILGTSVITSFHPLGYFVAFLLFSYIFTLTMLSKGESGQVNSKIALPPIIVVIGIVIALIFLQRFSGILRSDMFLFLGIFCLLALFTLTGLLKKPEAMQVRRTIRNLVLGIIFFDAAIAAGASSYLFGLLVASLILPAWFLSRVISVS